MKKEKTEKLIVTKDVKQILIDLHGEYVDKNFIMELYESKRLFDMLSKKSKDYNFRIATKEAIKRDDINITKYALFYENIIFYNKKHDVVCAIKMYEKEKNC